MAKQSAPAYQLLNLGAFPPEVEQALREDAANAGQDYGVEVVEESINGPASIPIFGVYLAPHPSAAKWEAAKAEFNITDDGVDEEAVAAQAQADAAANAEAAQAAADAAVEAIAGSGNKAKR